jgi:hypothetical protein
MEQMELNSFCNIVRLEQFFDFRAGSLDRLRKRLQPIKKFQNKLFLHSVILFHTKKIKRLNFKLITLNSI